MDPLITHQRWCPPGASVRACPPFPCISPCLTLAAFSKLCFSLSSRAQVKAGWLLFPDSGWLPSAGTVMYSPGSEPVRPSCSRACSGETYARWLLSRVVELKRWVSIERLGESGCGPLAVTVV